MLLELCRTRRLLGRYRATQSNIARQVSIILEGKQPSPVDLCHALEGKVDYALIGGHAITAHTTPRTTSDVDLLVRPSDWETVKQLLGAKRSWSLALPKPLVGIGLDVDGKDVDLVWADTPWAEEALATAKKINIGGPVRVISRPYLVLTKLYASRGEQDDIDVIMLLRVMSDDERIEAIDLVRRFLPSQLTDLKQMIAIADMK